MLDCIACPFLVVARAAGEHAELGTGKNRLRVGKRIVGGWDHRCGSGVIGAQVRRCIVAAGAQSVLPNILPNNLPDNLPNILADNLPDTLAHAVVNTMPGISPDD